jgi:predicted acylesterase/phospholipase RssA
LTGLGVKRRVLGSVALQPYGAGTHKSGKDATAMSALFAEEPPREFNRIAVVAIQGGGVYGISMLGQLSAVIDADICPGALAGTSAGAIVAALYWVGYSPKEIRDMFVELATAKNGPNKVASASARKTLVDLVGPFGQPPLEYRYERFHSLANRIERHYKGFLKILDNQSESDARRWSWIDFGYLKWSEIVVATVVGSLVAAACLVYWLLGSHATHTLILSTLLVWLILAVLVCRNLIWLLCSIASIIIEILTHPWPRRGFFSGDALEEFIHQKLCDSPKLSPFKNELDGQPLTFGALTNLQDPEREGEQLDLVPLILTATDLNTRELVLIASHEPRYATFPIAKAVRASAGFPVFFTPVEFSSELSPGCYVDGGVVANCPAWIFSREFRRMLISGSPWLRDLGARPWANIGLRLARDTKAAIATSPGGYLQAMYDLLRGKIRDQLEDELAAPLPHMIPMEQPEVSSGAPPRFLDVHKLSGETIKLMFDRGRRHAEEKLKNISFDLPKDTAPIRGALNDMIDHINMLLGESSNNRFRLRSNVFIPYEDRLVLRYGVNMDNAPDKTLILSGEKGLTGTCYASRRPYLCNLERLREWAKAETNPNATQLGMFPWEHLSLPEDRTFLINVPIFDPSDSWFLSEIPDRVRQESDALWAELPVDRDGAVLGVLNVDGAIPYLDMGMPSDPEVLALSERPIWCILTALWGCSLEIGRTLSHAFAKRV